MAKKAGCDGGFDGLCCRMVIETKRVFDGCASTDNNITLTLDADSALPQGAEFVSARVISSEFDDVSVSEGSGGCFNVCGDIVTRFSVTYVLSGTCYTVQATVRERKNVLLRLPNTALVPFSFEVQTVFSVSSGSVISPSAVSVTGCMLRIIKVVAPVDILVPTYGYCRYPPCTGCVCDADFGTRVFPFMNSENDGRRD